LDPGGITGVHAITDSDEGNNDSVLDEANEPVAVDAQDHVNNQDEEESTDHISR